MVGHPLAHPVERLGCRCHRPVFKEVGVIVDFLWVPHLRAASRPRAPCRVLACDADTYGKLTDSDTFVVVVLCNNRCSIRVVDLSRGQVRGVVALVISRRWVHRRMIHHIGILISRIEHPVVILIHGVRPVAVDLGDAAVCRNRSPLADGYHGRGNGDVDIVGYRTEVRRPGPFSLVCHQHVGVIRLQHVIVLITPSVATAVDLPYAQSTDRLPGHFVTVGVIPPVCLIGKRGASSGWVCDSTEHPPHHPLLVGIAVSACKLIHCPGISCHYCLIHPLWDSNPAGVSVVISPIVAFPIAERRRQ